MKQNDDIELKSNLELIVRERGKIVQREAGHNIFTNIGRQFVAEVITAQAFPSASTFTRHQDDIVRYIGFGIGGSRQSSSDADSSPFDTDYPGTNTQTDTDLTVTGLERPAAYDGTVATPGVPTGASWMKEVSAPGTFPLVTTTKFIALFTKTDINFGTYSSVPLSEIGLFKGAADPSKPNGSAGAYPGPGGHILAYDTFNTIHKTGLFSVEVRWELRI